MSYYRNRYRDGWGCWIWVVFILLVLMAQTCGSSVKPEVAVKALETQGFSDIEILAHEWWFVGWKGCDTRDAALFKARATNPVGKKVDVIVCTGWIFKGATVRTK